MGPQKDAEVQVPEVQKEAYLSKLPPADQANLQKIGAGFKKIMDEENRKGELVVVGGTLDKALPRKDIDILMVLQPHPEDVQQGTSTELDFALKDFPTFQHIVEKIIGQDSSFQIKEIIEPTMDEEFSSPSILKTDGSITIENKDHASMPIELVRIRERRTYREATVQDNRPFVILEHK